MVLKMSVNPRRTGIIDILRAMGADITLMTVSLLGAEPVADILVRGRSLQGIEVPLAHVVSAIDEFPAIFMAAACATGKTVIRGIQELRFKESDRIALMGDALIQLGVTIEMLPDGIKIAGIGSGGLRGATLQTGGDHRIAMACALGALRANGPICIKNADAITTSFPNFANLATMLGMQIEQH